MYISLRVNENEQSETYSQILQAGTIRNLAQINNNNRWACQYPSAVFGHSDVAFSMRLFLPHTPRFRISRSSSPGQVDHSIVKSEHESHFGQDKDSYRGVFIRSIPWTQVCFHRLTPNRKKVTKLKATYPINPGKVKYRASFADTFMLSYSLLSQNNRISPPPHIKNSPIRSSFPFDSSMGASSLSSCDSKRHGREERKRKLLR